MNILITFSGRGYDAQTKRTVEYAPKLGADRVVVYDDAWLLKTEFYRLNQWLWTYPEDQKPPSPRSPRGFGWFCWKPFILRHALDHFSASGDVVMFLDADTYPVDDFSMLFDICRENNGIMLFRAQGLNNRQWCKRDAFVVMGQDHPKYHNADAGVARFCLFEKGRWMVDQFLAEWLTYCLNPSAQTFEPSAIRAELEAFTEHRTEQAIMTNLAHKYGLKLWREACGFGEGSEQDKDRYPTLFRQQGSCTTREPIGSSYGNVDVYAGRGAGI